jgi:hypothetical protein
VSRYFGTWARFGPSLFADGFSARLGRDSDSFDLASINAAFRIAAFRAASAAGHAAAAPEAAATPEATVAPLADSVVPLAALLAPPPLLPIAPIAHIAASVPNPVEKPAFVGALLTSPGADSVALIYSDPHSTVGGSAILIDMATHSIIPTDAAMLNLGHGDTDQLIIGGDVGSGGLDPNIDFFEEVVFLGGSSYALSSADSNVAPGHSLTINGGPLGAGDSLDFNGSAETDGRFVLQGGQGADHFTGGAGNDILYGWEGADRLEGGGGADRFLYGGASDSTGAHYDTIVDFHFGEDVIDLPVTVTGLDQAVSHGSLSTASFDADLSAALGASALGAGHAILFTPDQGELSGQTFLVVDANGQAGYQAGEDYVIHLASAPPADLSGHAFLV